MKKTIRFAFNKTIPVLCGYLFIGIAFGLMLQKAGYNFLWAPLCSLVIYAGSMQYVLIALLVNGVNLGSCFLMTLFVNGRHIFYGLSFLDKFKKMGKAYPYMVFSLTDETYSVLCSLKVPKEYDEKKVMFLISLMNQIYWIVGSLLGAIIGDLIPVNTEGIEFAMTALFTVIFIDYWRESINRIPALVGLVAAILCLLILGASNFILPALLISTLFLLFSRSKLEKEEVK